MATAGLARFTSRWRKCSTPLLFSKSQRGPIMPATWWLDYLAGVVRRHRKDRLVLAQAESREAGAPLLRAPAERANAQLKIGTSCANSAVARGRPASSRRPLMSSDPRDRRMKTLSVHALRFENHARGAQPHAVAGFHRQVPPDHPPAGPGRVRADPATG
jgi:hypothetical protein